MTHFIWSNWFTGSIVFFMTIILLMCCEGSKHMFILPMLALIASLNLIISIIIGRTKSLDISDDDLSD